MPVLDIIIIMIRKILFTFLIISVPLIIGCIRNIKEEYDVNSKLEILKNYSEYDTINDKTLNESTHLT